MAEAPMTTRESYIEVAAVALWAGSDVDEYGDAYDFDRGLETWHATGPAYQDHFRKQAERLIGAIMRFGSAAERSGG